MLASLDETKNRTVLVRRTVLPALIVAALVLSGCAASDSTAPGGAGESAESGEADDGAAGGGEPTDTAPPEAPEVFGTATVGDVEYEMTRVYDCEREADDPLQFDFEFIALGRADTGEFVQLDILVMGTSNNTPLGFAADVSWQGPEGTLSSAEDADVSVGNERVTGGAILIDDEGAGVSVSLSFDIALPTEKTLCS